MTGVPKETHMYQPTPDFDDEEIDLGDLLGVLIENRWLIMAITLVALLIGGYKAFTAVPVYQADGLLQVEENNTKPAGKPRCCIDDGRVHARQCGDRDPAVSLGAG